jgi:hypothetical protein
MRKTLVGIFVGSAVCLWLQASPPQGQPETVDLGVAHRIRTEAFGTHSKVMDTAFYLTDVYGPRLTGSPELKAAAEWAIRKMNEWGLANVRMEPWGGTGTFGRGWSCTRFVAMMKEPGFQPIIGFARPWSPGTDGDVTGEAVLAVISSAEDMEPWRGKLKGKIVLAATPHADELPVAPLAVRLTDAELAAATLAPDPVSGNPSALPLGFFRATPAAAAAPGGRSGSGGRGFQATLNKFLKEEGVLAVVAPGGGAADGGTVMAQAAGSQNPAQEAPPPSVAIANEHYNRIARLLEKNIKVTLEFDIQTRFTEPADSFNITAEIPGSDAGAGLAMVGGHLDSWTGGTGATDNAAGAAVAMETMRILKSLDLKMARTVRVALWTGEEQGLLGSHAYVREHFADPIDMKPKPEHAKLSAYYNLDNGSGKIRGVYIQDNDQLRPIFEAWLDPFKDLGASTLTIRNTGSTDHVAFDAVGLPGLQFIQDPLDYSSRSHHSNMDLYDRLQANDLEQASAIMAWFAYNTAARPDLLPRKPMPQPSPGRGSRN